MFQMGLEKNHQLDPYMVYFSRSMHGWFFMVNVGIYQSLGMVINHQLVGFFSSQDQLVDFFSESLRYVWRAGEVAKVKLLELRQGDRICVRAGEAGSTGGKPQTDGSVDGLLRNSVRWMGSWIRKKYMSLYLHPEMHRLLHASLFLCA